MKTQMSRITVQTNIPLSREKVWELWTNPEHIKNWNFASEEWHCPAAQNDLKKGGKFVWRMEAKDESMGFDFSGVYKEIKPKEKIKKVMDDGREIQVRFIESDQGTLVEETFEPESQNSRELQQQGWQAILDNFKKYALSVS